jgi:nucleoside-diphosphate-sugar epimerase
MIILLTGRDGQVGWELQRTLAPLGQVVAPEREELDLTALRRVRDTVRRTHPDVIVNAAAYTAVDRAEDEAELASVINAEAPEALAEEAERCGALLLHYSTDYVFSGAARRPYRRRSHRAAQRLRPQQAAGRNGDQAKRRARDHPAHGLGVCHPRPQFPAHHSEAGSRASRAGRRRRSARCTDLGASDRGGHGRHARHAPSP